MDAVRAELKRRREDLGLTPAEAGRLAGISAQWWRNLEDGYQVKGGGIRIPARITRNRLIKMAKALKWDVNDALAMAEGEPLSPRERDRTSISDELARMADTLSISQQRLLLLLAKSMADPATPVPGIATPGSVTMTRIAHDETAELPNNHSLDGDGSDSS